MLQCRKILKELHSCNVSLVFIKRFANTVAYCVARATSSIVDRRWSREDIPAMFADVIRKDLI